MLNPHASEANLPLNHHVNSVCSGIAYLHSIISRLTTLLVFVGLIFADSLMAFWCLIIQPISRDLVIQKKNIVTFQK